ncbi:salicylate hydroxylase, putative [Talaromyces stipitatus ATCC 10500]|uniref:Salicylate hydroxylase, putative n=1 Tax=Talaromyces stipitatus (strain ATCC 10500 / CBS 375.48 / QM 6759 / NRRL 1006) TaxID=441959 RepID=B8LZK4_TALSN|nr:salicylate hydroxylase, putative [Talaromyces stipitatus ATCC 10500]EED22427.1 salicylate hydroxylase, putative [Talaromyces stipitatus ATCC 10500]
MISKTESATWQPLSIAVVGGGIGGLAAGISLRRAGHAVTIYERADYAGEVGASISCAANGTRWLHEWGVNVEMGDPVILRKLINRDWETGEATNVYDLADYEEKWGHVYNMFHRQYMHAMLMDSALGEAGEGTPVKLVVNHKCVNIDSESGLITFENGNTAQHDVVIGADGIGSVVRGLIDIHQEKKPSSSSCLHTNVTTEEAVALGLIDYSKNSAIEYWGGHGTPNKIVLSPCNGGKLLSYYCFFPREKGDYATQKWDEEATVEELLAPYPDLDRNVFKHLSIGKDIRPWRLWVHQPYEWWQKGVVCLMGDAAHPMMPDQSQGACMAIEDAACLGLVFSKEHFRGDIRKALEVYEEIRKPRATRVQVASQRARENIYERIGFSSNTNNEKYTVQNESNKLTIEEMNSYDMKEHAASVFGQRAKI